MDWRTPQLASRPVRAAVRVMAILALVGASMVGGYWLGLEQGRDAGSASCGDVTARKKTIASDAQRDLQGLFPDDRDRRILSLLEETAILMEQNPKCFSPAERAKAEADYRRWERALSNR